MPYIKQTIRDDLCKRAPMSPGELNYIITDVIRQYWDDSKDYTAINDILGALEGAKLEFYRRIAVPYENAKMAENGDVY